MKRAAVLVLLLLVGCSPNDGGRQPNVEPARMALPQSPGATPSRPSLADIVHDPGAQLLDVRVGGRAGSRTVNSAWLLGKRRAIATSDDAFATTTYRAWSLRNARRYIAGAHDFGGDRSARVGLPGLLAWPVPFIARPGLPQVAVLGGGDGATLFPFDKAARFEDGTWRAYDVPLVDGERGYVSGGVVLPHGRLLVLLDHWSGDRNGHPSAVWHGLWASRGEDWSSYLPVRPRVRGQAPAVEGSTWTGLSGATGRTGVAWLTSWDDRVYVSRDGVRWREIRVR